MPCRIAILGDSSSSGIGLGRDCYPAKLLAHLREEIDVQILNYAVPGFTSADASRFFHAVGAKERTDYLIIYLGNNEAAHSAQKGYYSPAKASLTAWITRPPPKQFRPVLSPPRFRFQHQVAPPVPATTPLEFRKNLRSIVRCATRQGTEVILINPVANARFPCGVGTPNSSYMCYLDDLDRLGYEIKNQPADDIAKRLSGGIEHFTAGRWSEAIASWQPVAPIAGVAGFIARHNLACARARLGDSAGESQLRALLGQFPRYDSTILYNLAQLMERRDDREGAADLGRQALEADVSVYRIHEKYRDAIATFASTRDVRILDLAPILTAEHFIDYCHPTGAGHERIALALAQLIRDDHRATGLVEGSRHEITLPTPNYLHDPGQTLIDYYCMDWPIDRLQIAALVEGQRQAHPSDPPDDTKLGACIRNFFESNRQHPIFTANIEFSGSWIPRSHEILSFPEFFLYRVLRGYSAAYESAGLAARLSAAPLLEPIRFSSNDYERIILRQNGEPLDIDLDLREAYQRAIVEKVRDQLTSDSAIFRPTIGERLRTVTRWYTREAFRYGTQSRLSMLYARWDIERLIEGLVVAIVIAESRQEAAAGHIEALDRLLLVILELIGIHERHVDRYHQNERAFSIAAYGSDLAQMRQAVENELCASAIWL